jgi:hypothetical protein
MVYNTYKRASLAGRTSEVKSPGQSMSVGLLAATHINFLFNFIVCIQKKTTTIFESTAKHDVWTSCLLSR